MSVDLAGQGRLGVGQCASCWYQLHAFSEWEVLQRDSGLTTARDIEKALRWDEASSSDQGNESAIVARIRAQAGPRGQPPDTGMQ